MFKNLILSTAILFTLNSISFASSIPKKNAFFSDSCALELKNKQLYNFTDINSDRIRIL